MINGNEENKTPKPVLASLALSTFYETSASP